jgi:hypothetical protein
VASPRLDAGIRNRDLKIVPALLLACLAGAGGCNGDRVATYATSGKVVFEDGRPLGGGSVIFQSDEHPLTARGMIQEDGTFELGTYETGDGAVAGKHQVAVLAPKAQQDTDEQVVLPEIDVKYQDPRRSEIVLEVTPDGDNQFQITVTPPQGRR